MENEIDHDDENYFPLTDPHRREILLMWPDVTKGELDEAVEWSDWGVRREIEEENLSLEADTIVEIEVDVCCMHVYFLLGIITGSMEV